MTRAAWLVLALLPGVIVAAQEPGPNDEQRSAWRFRRTVTVPAEAGGRLLAVPVPPEVQARSQPDLRDLRLVDADGREAPFIVHEDNARRAERRWTGRLDEARQERRRDSAWTVDLGEIVSFNRLELDIPSTAFSKRLAVETSVDGAAWEVAGTDFLAFDRIWQAQNVHDTTLDVGARQARFVRLVADDTRSRPISLRGVTAVQADDLPGATWSAEVRLERIGSGDGRTRYRVPVADGHPVRRLAIDADDPGFARGVTVFERRGDEERAIGSGLVYRLRLPDETADPDGLEIGVTRASGGALVVEIADGDNPPLENPRVRLSGPRTLLVASTTAHALTLYYGNSVTRPAVYDLEQLRTALAVLPTYPLASLGPEAENPRFRQPAPLAFVAARGAAVDARAWRFARPVAITGPEDIYTMVVSPPDLAQLRRDLGDLRIVDEANRQVPYVLEHDADVARVELAIETARPRQDRAQTSAYQLAAPRTIGDGRAVRFASLRLRFAEPFFRRNAVVLVRRPSAPLGVARVATAVVAASAREGAADEAWVEIPLDIAAGELTLEIDDGDNAPLTLRQAQAVAPVPRVTFKAGPGAYRLLLGNDEATPPSYELGTLAREVLAWSAVPVAVPDPLGPAANPAYERGVTDLIREAPPALVLWGSLGVALVVLLGLTWRILRRTS
ncbi:MAG: DUF3999 family protein [Vicinamibacterales bacterium]